MTDQLILNLIIAITQFCSSMPRTQQCFKTIWECGHKVKYSNIILECGHKVKYSNIIVVETHNCITKYIEKNIK